MNARLSLRPRAAQRGLTLIELMISIVIGMLMIAALATLMANQSTNRYEIDRTGKMLENGRYSLSTISADAMMAGFWGERKTAPSVPAAVPDPCSTAVADLESAMGVAVQGYDSGSAAFPACAKNRLTGTDVLVVRRLDTDTVALASLANGQVYVQTGLNATGTQTYVIGQASSDAAANATKFSLKKRDGTTANIRKYLVHIYYVAQCSVEAADGTCTGADSGSPIPTLKRVDLSVSGAAMSTTCASCRVTIAEGIENLQVDYATDTDATADGIPNIDTNGRSCPIADCSAYGLTFPYTGTDWGKVMAIKVYLLARTTEKSPGFTDDKTYSMGTYGTASAPSADAGYKRHMFVQSVKLVNPVGWNLL